MYLPDYIVTDDGTVFTLWDSKYLSDNAQDLQSYTIQELDLRHGPLTELVVGDKIEVNRSLEPGQLVEFDKYALAPGLPEAKGKVVSYDNDTGVYTIAVTVPGSQVKPTN